MEEKNINTEPQENPAEINPEIRLLDAVSGVFTEPGETFSVIGKQQIKRNYWPIPLVILIVVSVLSSLLVMNDEEIASSIKEKQKKTMQEQFDKLVREGKMTREEANQKIEANEKMFSGTLFIIFGLVGAFISTIIFFFLKSLIYFGALRLLKSIVNFTTVLNVVGLAGLISCIQILVNTVLAVFTGKIAANLGPLLFLQTESFGKEVYVLLASVDLLNFWYLGVLGIGLAKVSSFKTSTTLGIVITLWLIWVMLVAFGPFKFFSGV